MDPHLLPPPAPAKREARTLGADRRSLLQLVALGGDHEGRVIPMRHGVVLGRSSDASATIDDDDVSRHHAKLELDEATGVWRVQDLESRNGTWVNGTRAQLALLGDGDVLRLGARVSFKVTANDPLESELRERQRLELVGRLSAGVVHDFNNMIAAGIANVDYLRGVPREERSTQDVDDALEDILVALQRAAELAARLLHAARGDQGPSGTVEVSRMCEEVASLLRRVIPAAIQLEIDVAPRLRVAGFSGSLQQVLVNLCLNARDAMPAGGSLSIGASFAHASTTGPAEEVVIRVSDTGTGMDDETRRRIFEPFFTTKREGRGFGLGLAMSADIVAQHGGRIEVESLVGRGTTFQVHLPAIRRRSAKTAATLAQAGRAVDGTGFCVLVVDDQQVVRRGLRRVLEQAHFQVLEAPDGVSALGLVASSPTTPHVAIVDFDMPGMNGIETCSALRSAASSVQTILVTGGTLDCADAGEPGSAVGALLDKPIAAQALLSAVLEGLQRAGAIA